MQLKVRCPNCGKMRKTNARSRAICFYCGKSFTFRTDTRPYESKKTGKIVKPKAKLSRIEGIIENRKAMWQKKGIKEEDLEFFRYVKPKK